MACSHVEMFFPTNEEADFKHRTIFLDENLDFNKGNLVTLQKYLRKIWNLHLRP